MLCPRSKSKAFSVLKALCPDRKGDEPLVVGARLVISTVAHRRTDCRWQLTASLAKEEDCFVGAKAGKKKTGLPLGNHGRSI